jgi:hypothetical protein
MLKNLTGQYGLSIQLMEMLTLDRVERSHLLCLLIHILEDDTRQLLRFSREGGAEIISRLLLSPNTLSSEVHEAHGEVSQGRLMGKSVRGGSWGTQSGA